MQKFMYTLCGCYCAYFYRNHDRTLLFCGYLSYLILFKSAEIFRKYAHSFIYALM
jgi:hypothetical protein